MSRHLAMNVKTKSPRGRRIAIVWTVFMLRSPGPVRSPTTGLVSLSVGLTVWPRATTTGTNTTARIRPVPSTRRMPNPVPEVRVKTLPIHHHDRCCSMHGFPISPRSRNRNRQTPGASHTGSATVTRDLGTCIIGTDAFGSPKKFPLRLRTPARESFVLFPPSMTVNGERCGFPSGRTLHHSPNLWPMSFQSSAPDRNNGPGKPIYRPHRAGECSVARRRQAGSDACAGLQVVTESEMVITL
ncbi:hypothetical protein ZHAS_00001413 [Anopheles sinensis]|uniref:Uncharacterized protein n=1 Tax=Anopheles sinensis TaxID=74873 RepID=A0A084VBA4_ANOSI|nr:hypothetical protein ZHAS_00001413 [Anopheles sinensis]